MADVFAYFIFSHFWTLLGLETRGKVSRENSKIHFPSSLDTFGSTVRRKGVYLETGFCVTMLYMKMIWMLQMGGGVTAASFEIANDQSRHRLCHTAAGRVPRTESP